MSEIEEIGVFYEKTDPCLWPVHVGFLSGGSGRRGDKNNN
jgi:hypothetical protein